MLYYLYDLQTYVLEQEDETGEAADTCFWRNYNPGHSFPRRLHCQSGRHTISGVRRYESIIKSVIDIDKKLSPFL